MKRFRCQACDNVVHFENRTCGRCGHRLGYMPELGIVGALDPAGEPNWTAAGTDRAPRRFCANADHDVCNWLVRAGAPDRLCRACRPNDTIPDISVPEHLAAGRELELAKHRLFYSLLRWKLPLKTRAEDPERGLAFEFLADPPGMSGPKVMTGHDNGIVTIALAEAHPAELERRRSELDETYRTVLGHFRHEVGHPYWDVLVRDGGRLEAFRAIFGDDTQDYGAALQRHYQERAPANWRASYVSAYAASHPWEDFAETWAHYLHIVDTLDTANAFGLGLAPAIDRERAREARVDFDPYVSGDMDQIMEAWAPVAVAVNSINRSTGKADLYPFVISPAVVRKLGFVHGLVRGGLRLPERPRIREEGVRETAG